MPPPRCDCVPAPRPKDARHAAGSPGRTLPDEPFGPAAHMVAGGVHGRLAVGLVVALAVLWRYPRTPGPSGTLHLSAGREPAGEWRFASDLIMFAHPRCPAPTPPRDLRAVIGPFAARLETIVAFTQPQARADWLETDTWMDAAPFPACAVVADETPARPRLFGSRTSGQVVLYDPQGAPAVSAVASHRHAVARGSPIRRARWRAARVESAGSVSA